MSSAGSPSAYLLWTILSVLFLVFLLTHLWNYDRFQCVKWNSGRQPGAFKRVMTYSYLGTIPLFVVFTISMTVLKYLEGYLVRPGVENETINEYQIIPKPVPLWSDAHRSWLLPIYFVLSTCWSLELVTHLEGFWGPSHFSMIRSVSYDLELTFWLYLMNQGPEKRDWFHSWEFRTWYLGCMAAFLVLFCTTVGFRHDLDLCYAHIFIVGGSASTLVTVSFLYVLARFPGFIRNIKQEGATPDVVVRLTTFYQLNIARVMLRFLFTLPLLAIGIDGIQAEHLIINHSLLSDLLFMLGGIGCFVSSAMTLMIFFPRSITREQGYKVKLSTPHPSLEKATIQAGHEAFPSPLPQSQDQYHDPSQLSRFKFPPEPSRASLLPQPSNIRFRDHDNDSLESNPPEFHDGATVFGDDYDENRHPNALSHDRGGPNDSPRASLSLQTRIGRTSSSSPIPIPVPSPPPPRAVPPPSPPFLNRYSNELHALQRSVTSSPISRRLYTKNTRWQHGRTHQGSVNLHPYVQTFTSPIDLLDSSQDLSMK